MKLDYIDMTIKPYERRGVIHSDISLQNIWVIIL